MGKIIEFSPNCKLTVDYDIIRAGHPQPGTELAKQGRQEVPTLEPAMRTSLASVWNPFFIHEGMGEYTNTVPPS